MRRIALIVLATVSPILLVALLIGGPTAGVIFAVSSPLMPVALMALGDRRPERTGREAAWLLAWLASLEIGTVGMLLLGGHADPAAGVWGLPLSAVLMIVALGIVPLVVVPLGHALLFPVRVEPHAAERPPGRPGTP